jgi:fucose 4-O-acetylase-like acetyltransferase
MSLTKRDPFLDNARYILVLLVVFGHLISPWKESSEIIFAINNLLATFRMPALIFITGYFAKSFYKAGYIKKITVKLFVPLVILQVFYILYYTAYGDTLNLFLPRKGLWFLLSLYYFNLLLFPFSKLKHPLLVSILLGLGIGFIDYAGSFLSISRTFVFFPIFLLGFYTNKTHLQYIKKYANKAVSIIAFIVIIYLLSFYSFEEARKLLTGKFPFERLEYSYFEGIVSRFLSYVMMTLGIIAILAWIPRKKTFFTKFGQQTAYIYLLHFIVVRYLYTIEWFDEFALWKLPIVIVVAFLITLVLSSKTIIQVTKPVIEGTIIYSVTSKYRSIVFNYNKVVRRNYS